MVATALIGAGGAWSVLFPKKMSLEWDMVLSVGIGIGLVGTGLLVLWGNRKRVPVLTLSTMLLWSLVVNAYLLAWQRDVADSVMAAMTEQPTQPMQTDLHSADR